MTDLLVLGSVDIALLPHALHHLTGLPAWNLASMVTCSVHAERIRWRRHLNPLLGRVRVHWRGKEQGQQTFDNKTTNLMIHTNQKQASSLRFNLSLYCLYCLMNLHCYNGTTCLCLLRRCGRGEGHQRHGGLSLGSRHLVATRVDGSAVGGPHRGHNRDVWLGYQHQACWVHHPHTTCTYRDGMFRRQTSQNQSSQLYFSNR